MVLQPVDPAPAAAGRTADLNVCARQLHADEELAIAELALDVREVLLDLPVDVRLERRTPVAEHRRVEREQLRQHRRALGVVACTGCIGGESSPSPAGRCARCRTSRRTYSMIAPDSPRLPSRDHRRLAERMDLLQLRRREEVLGALVATISYGTRAPRAARDALRARVVEVVDLEHGSLLGVAPNATTAATAATC